jgi:hypothetical protein
LLSDVQTKAARNYIIFGLLALLAMLAAVLGGRLFIQRPVNALLNAIDRWR